MKTTYPLNRGTKVGQIVIASAIAATAIFAISPAARAVDLVSPADLGTVSLNGAPVDIAAIIEADVAFATALTDPGTASMYGFTLETQYKTSGIFGNTTVSIGNAGAYVFDVSSVNLSSGSTLTIDAPKGANVLFDISGAFLVSGGKIILTGGLQSSTVLFNLTGTSGGNGSVDNGTVQGNVLGAQRNVDVTGTSNVQGAVVAQQTQVAPTAVVTSPEF